jgi:serine/threonine protein kinase/Flp pilus assembly protein TadD
MNEKQWGRLTELFERLLAGAEPEAVLNSEPDAEIRAAVMNLWLHHIRADKEDYLGAPMEFDVVPVFHEGQVLSNRFRIEKLLGCGGMGEVYLAWDERMEDRVALKTIARLLAPSQSIRRRFIAEVQNARRVTHPNICRIHELFEEGETVFFSMERLEGVLLSEILGGEYVARHARAIAKQMAEGLHAAHQTGVVHGDFKPANVMIVPGAAAPSKAPRAVIMDFGLARGLDRAAEHRDEGLSVRAGTADYMAPELRAGGSATVRTDIFAFGKVGQELLPNERMWDECVRALPEERPDSLDKIIQRLQSRTSRRYWIAGLAIASVATARYAFWPPRRTSAAVPEDARILVNGFRAIAEQLAGARLARSLVVTALQQSPRIRAIADQDVLPVLRRLRPGESLPLAGRPLSDLLTQIRAAFWVDGDLRQAGGRYSLDVRLLAASGQQVVAASAFRDAPNVVEVAQAAARWLRTSVGESGQSLKANQIDVRSYTSAIPEALQEYYDAMEHYAVGEMDQAVPLLQEAVRLDPGFAQAHSTLGLTTNASRRYEEGFREIDLAMQLARKLPERERISIETSYYGMTQDSWKAGEAAKRNVAIYPDEPRCCGALGQIMLDNGNPAEAVYWCRKAVDLAPDDWMQIQLLVNALVESGEFPAALREFQVALSRRVSNKWIYNGAGSAYMGLGQYDDAIAAFSNQPLDSENSIDIQSAKIMQGHLEIAIAAMEEQLASARNPIEAHQAREFLCGLSYVADRPESALRHVQAMADLPEYPPMGRRFACTASWARRLHDDETLARVRGSVGAIAQRWPNARTESEEMHARALELWRTNALDQAEALLLQASGSAFSICTLFDLAEFFTVRGKWDLADTYWREFEEHSGTVIVKGWFPGLLVMGWLNRAVVAQARKDREAALKYSQEVLNHWMRANARLQVVQAAQRISSGSRPF